MDDREAFNYMLSTGIPIVEMIKKIVKAPSEQVPETLGLYIKEMAEAIEPGGVNNTKLMKYLAGSTGAIVGLLIAGSVVSAAKE